MKCNEFFYFFSIFRILFVAQKVNYFNSEWVQNKKNNDTLLNEVCVNYLTSLQKYKETQDPDDLKKDLILLAALLRKKFKIRALVSKSLYFCDSVFLKSAIAVLYLYGQLLKNYVSQIFSVPFEFQIDENLVGKRISFAIGFPNHSFNFKKNSSNYPSSFAEYFIKSQAEANKKDMIISLDEYTRKSKIKEITPNSSDSEILKLEVIKSRKKFSILSLFEWPKYLAMILFQLKSKTIGLYLLESSLRMRTISHQIFIQKIEMHNQVLEVYILPFSDYLALSFCKELQNKSNIYYYSDNMLIPPTSFHLDDITYGKVNKFEDGNYSSFYGLNRTSGFVRTNNFFKKAAQDIFFRQQQEEPSASREMPGMLGFESLLKVKDWSGAYTVSIFDVPPETDFQQFCRSSSGDKTSDIQFVSDFLNDFKNGLFEINIRVLYKPKYSLSNYVDEYRSLIASLSDSMKTRFIILDPYVRVGDIIEKSDLVISFPYTSIKKFADFYGKKSLYYVPDKYADVFRAYCGYSLETIYGINELERFINDQK